jgi:hypothetical protein
MSDPKTSAQINLEHGGFVNAETERVVKYFEDEIFDVTFEKIRRKPRVKKYKPKSRCK